MTLEAKEKRQGQVGSIYGKPRERCAGRSLPSKCQYSGIAQNKKPMKENVENSAFGDAMREEALRAEERMTKERWEGWNEGKGRRDLGDIRERGRWQRPCTLRMDTRLWIVDQKPCVFVPVVGHCCVRLSVEKERRRTQKANKSAVITHVTRSMRFHSLALLFLPSLCTVLQ